MSQAALGRAVGMPGPHVNMVCRGKATPPMDKITDMAIALGIRDKSPEAQQFLEAGHLSHATPYVRALVASLRSGPPTPGTSAEAKRIAELEAKISDLQARLSVISSLVVNAQLPENENAGGKTKKRDHATPDPVEGISSRLADADRSTKKAQNADAGRGAPAGRGAGAAHGPR